jgi:hypothetical protein
MFVSYFCFNDTFFLNIRILIIDKKVLFCFSLNFNSLQCWSSTSGRLQKHDNKDENIACFADSYFFHSLCHNKSVLRDESYVLNFIPLGHSSALSGIYRNKVFSVMLKNECAMASASMPLKYNSVLSKLLSLCVSIKMLVAKLEEYLV